ncbi:uncharacterized protein MONBRDRAFT_6698 [Monosiga brevicollis MX1]|uniref:Uncharacterized protein n=1 Tax=Monosiga brevicollis TaxID=81824 RepID=A9UV12_MONBE|nr:uncharacterized protein MONBRDRAFT_6698 [Monosiga brevicollis MX1]EDQ90810.1 predicted protein [Monosiga brevicollis MX1]|eukprot:XP_001744107.1 hypothetical protein [Monosiga brevicollis MX1]
MASLFRNRSLRRQQRKAARQQKREAQQATPAGWQGMPDDALLAFRREQGLVAGTERLMDWGEVRHNVKPRKEAFMMMQANDGSWQDIRLVLHATYLSVQKFQTQARALVEGVPLLQVTQEQAADILHRQLDKVMLASAKVVRVPLACCAVSRFVDNGDAYHLGMLASCTARSHNAFVVRSAHDVTASVVLRPRLVLRMGRVHERLADGTWRDFFMVLTDHDVAFYNAAPSKSEDLRHAVTAYPLLAVRYVSGHRKVDPQSTVRDGSL